MHEISLQDRLKGMVWGQFAAIAAAKHMHSSSNIRPNHADQKTIGLSYYYDAAYLLLQSIVNQQSLSIRDYGTRFVGKFASPDYFPHVNRTTRETIENYYQSLQEGHPDWGYDFQGGADHQEIDAVTRLAPLLVLYWRNPNLLSFVDKATRVTQNNELGVAYSICHSRILCSLLQGEKLRTALEKETRAEPHDTPLDLHIRKKINIAFDLESQNSQHAPLGFGQKSHLDESFPSAIHTALVHENALAEAVVETVRLGGEISGRAALIGSWQGAQLGIQSVPESWRRHVDNYDEIEKEIENLLLLQLV